MATQKRRAQKAAGPKVGDVVRFTHGLSTWTGEVVEDRGCIGISGARLFGVRFPLDPAYEQEERYTELPADRLEIVRPAA